jgi:hypothetical protein
LLRTISQAINRCTGFFFAQGIVGECGTPQDAEYRRAERGRTEPTYRGYLMLNSYSD